MCTCTPVADIRRSLLVTCCASLYPTAVLCARIWTVSVPVTLVILATIPYVDVATI